MPKSIAMLFGLIMLVFMYGSCDTDPQLPDNPYSDNSIPTSDTTNIVQHDTIPEGSFAYLHQKIFSPTCANSGCHDGTFEPDFRTIQSTYNSLVNKNALKTDPNVAITKRVLPFSPQGSMLWYRLNNFMPNTSGIMPLVTDPNSDWEAQKSVYLQQIEAWIQAGAPNVGE